MKIQIEVTKALPIGVVASIPAGKFIRIVGKNGVGKSLAANLLATASGDYRFRDEKSFTTLRSSLRKVKIVVSEGDRTLLAELNPATWRWDDLESRINPGSLGDFKIDGKRVSATTFFEEFSVKIVRGNEGLETQLADIGRSLANAYGRLFDAHLTKVMQLSVLAQGIRDALLYREVEKLAERQRTYHENVGKAMLDPERISLFTTLLLELASSSKIKSTEIKISDLIQAMRARVEEEAQSEARLIERRRRIEATSADKEALSRDLLLTEAIRAEVNELSSSMPLKEENLMTVEGLEEEDELCRQEEEELTAANVEFQKLSYASAVQDQVPKLIVGLGSDYERTGTPVQTTDVLSIRQPRVNRTTRQLLSDFAFSFRRSRETLRDNPALRELDERWSKLQEHQKSIADQRRGIERLTELKRSLADIQRRIDRLHLGNAAELTTLTSKLVEGRETRRSAQFALDILERNFRDELDKKLSVLLRQTAGIESHDLGGALGEIRSQYERIKDLEAERKAIVSFESRYFENLNSSGIATLPLSVRTSVEHRNVESISQVVSRLGVLAGLDWYQYLRDEVVARVNQVVQPSERERGEGWDDFYRAVNEILGTILTNQLNQEPFRKFVFKSPVIQVDPASGSVVLQTAQGPTPRSLNDFSTGERAFAYSVASILANRRLTPLSILFLDEFGAVLDQDRERYVTKIVNEQMSEIGWPSMAVTLLPYKGDLERDIERLKNPRIPEAERSRLRTELESKKTQFEKYGYYAERLEIEA